MIAHVPTGAWIAYLGVAFRVAFGLLYASSAARGLVAPSPVSWSVWTLTTGTACTAGLLAGDTVGVVVAGGAFVWASSTLAAIMVPRVRRWPSQLRALWPTLQLPVRLRRPRPASARGAQWWLDRSCLTVCAFTFVAWWFTQDSVLAIKLSIATDLAAAVPTLVQAWRREETVGAFASAAFAAATTLIVLPLPPTFLVWGYPVYEFWITLSIAAVVWLRGSPVGVHGRRLALSARRRQAVVVGYAAALVSVLGLVSGLLPAPAPALALASAPSAGLPAAPVTVVAAPAALADVANGPAPAVRPVRASTAWPTVRPGAIAVDRTPYAIAITPNGRQAWVTHRETGKVTAIDITTGRAIGTVTVTAGPPQFVAFCPDGRTAYVSIFPTPPTPSPAAAGMPAMPGMTDPAPPAPHMIAVIDTASVTQVGEIRDGIGRRPYPAACSADGRTLVVPSHDDAQLDIVDTATNRVVRTVATAANPHWSAFDKTGHLWVANHDSNVISVYDGLTWTPLGSFPLTLPGQPSCVSPHALAVSPTAPRLAVACFGSDQAWIVDVTTHRPVAVAALGHGANPQAVAWTADGRRLLTADNSSGTVSVIDADTGQRTATLPVESPTSVATTPDGAIALVASLDTATVVALDVAAPYER